MFNFPNPMKWKSTASAICIIFYAITPRVPFSLSTAWRWMFCENNWGRDLSMASWQLYWIINIIRRTDAWLELSTGAGLPDGLFSNQKSQFWINFGGPCNGKSWYILWPFGLFYCYWKYLMAIWYFVPRKIWQPWTGACIIFFAIEKGVTFRCRKPSCRKPSCRMTCCSKKVVEMTYCRNFTL
jgi:hypothetical protein